MLITAIQFALLHICILFMIIIVIQDYYDYDKQ